MNKVLVTLFVGMLCITLASATYTNFFYSESCPHCSQVYPLVYDLSKTYDINFLDVNKGSYNVQGVPTVLIKTSDDREIVLVGSQEIPRYLECELQEMSTMECPTGSYNKGRQSWFIE